jgi:hypothetical protein
MTPGNFSPSVEKLLKSLAVYFSGTVHIRSNGSRIHVNVISLNGCLQVVEHFNKYANSFRVGTQFINWVSFSII